MRSAAAVLALFCMLLTIWVAFVASPVVRKVLERKMPALESPYALKPTATSRKR
jgi:hypothetical protein